MSKVLEFGVSSTRLAIVAGCLVLAILVAGGAGFAAGVLLAPQFASTKPVVAASKAKQAAPKVLLPKPEPQTAAKAQPPVAQRPESPAPPQENAARLVESKPAPKGAATAAKAVHPIQLDVQVGSFTDEKRAQSTVDRLKRSGYPAFAFRWTDSSSRDWHVVQVGPYAAYETASGIVLELATRYKMDPVIIPARNF